MLWPAEIMTRCDVRIERLSAAVPPVNASGGSLLQSWLRQKVDITLEKLKASMEANETLAVSDPTNLPNEEALNEEAPQGLTDEPSTEVKAQQHKPSDSASIVLQPKFPYGTVIWGKMESEFPSSSPLSVSRPVAQLSHRNLHARMLAQPSPCGQRWWCDQEIGGRLQSNTSWEWSL